MTASLPPRNIVGITLLVLTLVFALTLVFSRAVPAHAGGVVTDCSSQRGLVNAMNSGSGNISFNCGGTNAPATIVITQPGGLSVNSGQVYRIDGGDSITLTGQDSVRLFEVQGGALTLTHIILTHGRADNGGALLNSGGLLVLSHATVRDSQSKYAGGGFETWYGTTTVLDSLIENNRSDAAGGGIWSIGTLTLSNSTLSGNSAYNAGGGIANFGTATLYNSILSGNFAYQGGGIVNDGGTLTLSNSTLSGNSATFVGGGLLNPGTATLSNSTLSSNSANQGGGIFSGGTLTLSDSTLSSNSATTLGGGIFSGGTLTLSDSTLSSNSANQGGGIWNNGTATLYNSTLSGNSAAYGGGGIWNNNTAMLTLSNSTLSRNSADQGGGIFSIGTLTLSDSTLSSNSAGAGGGLTNIGTVTLYNSTLSGNSAYDGGGIYNNGTPTLINVTLSNRVAATGKAHNLYLYGGVLTLINTIVSFDAASGANCFAGGVVIGPGISSGGHNLANDTSCGLTSAGDQQSPSVPILLGPLGNHGGPTLTQLPRTGSAAIDNGDNAACAAPPVNNLDQRGMPRPANGVCDIGAVERQPSDIDVIPGLWLPLLVR